MDVELFFSFASHLSLVIDLFVVHASLFSVTFQALQKYKEVRKEAWNAFVLPNPKNPR